MAIKKSEDSFWKTVDSLVHESEIVIDRPKGSHHPRYPELDYLVDYGYLKNTTAMDGAALMSGAALSSGKIDAIVCTVDLRKKDSEIKILIGCSAAEKKLILPIP